MHSFFPIHYHPILYQLGSEMKRFIQPSHVNIKEFIQCLDNKLHFSDHTLHVTGKLAKSIGILFKIRSNLPTQARLNYGFVYPYLAYNVIVWGGTYSSHLKNIITQHKRSIMVLADSFMGIDGYLSWCIHVENWISVLFGVTNVRVVVFAIFILLRNTSFSHSSEAGIVITTTLLLTWMKH